MNIAVIDDDKIFVSKIQNRISQICIEKQILCEVDMFYDGDAIVRNYSKYQLIFLDIDMPCLNGIEAAQKINTLKNTKDIPFIVFVTGKDNLVFNALRQFPYSFIRKAFLEEGIEKCICNVNAMLETKQQKYAVKVGRNIIFIDLNNVLYLEKEKNYVNFHTPTEIHKERSNIDDKSKSLQNKGFIRTHIGYLVNTKHVAEITANSIVLDNGVKIPVGIKYKADIKKRYFDWLVRCHD